MTLHDDQRHPAEREAARLRIIMEAFLAADPYMKLQDAIPAIFAAELKTRDMEEVQAREAKPKEFELPDDQPETIAKWMDLVPDVMTMMTSGNKIHAIREIRLRTLVARTGRAPGLKEAKDGAEHWEATRRRPSSSGTAARPKPMWMSSATAMSEDIANWMNQIGQADIIDYMNASKKIQAIKEVRSRFPGGAGLKEAKDGVEYWERKFR